MAIRKHEILMIKSTSRSSKLIKIGILSISLFLFSCKDTSSPKAIAEQFLFSLRTLDIEKAKSISTKNTWDFLNILESSSEQITDDEKEELGRKLKIKITDINEESDSTIIVTYISDPKILPFNKIRMLKNVDKNGKDRWKVDISTIDLVENDELILQQQNNIFDEEPILDDTTQNQAQTERNK